MTLRRPIPVLLVCVVLSAALLAGTAAAPPALHTGDVPAGSLGYRLGSYLTIEGTRADGFKTGIRTLIVDRVNGQKVGTPVAIWIDNLDLPARTRTVVRGYETLRMIGQPPA